MRHTFRYVFFRIRPKASNISRSFNRLAMKIVPWIASTWEHLTKIMAKLAPNLWFAFWKTPTVCAISKCYPLFHHRDQAANLICTLANFYILLWQALRKCAHLRQQSSSVNNCTVFTCFWHFQKCTARSIWLCRMIEIFTYDYHIKQINTR